jgi:electron transfer flavoprotein alpha subunit
VKIVCPVKQVPAPGAIEFDPDTQTLKREGVPLILSPFDRYAVQHAVALRDATGGELVVISMGPPQSEAALRECLALGADRAVLLSDELLVGSDTIATTRSLALALEKEGFDLVLCGRRSIDAETAQVPPELAAFLRIPCLTNVVAVELNGEVLRATRDADDAEEVWEASGQAVISVAAPPPTTAPAAAGGDRIDKWTPLDLVDEVYEYDKRFGQNGSPTRVLAVRDVTPERARVAAASVEEARATIDRLLDERAVPPPSWEKPPHAAEQPAAHYDCWTFVETRDGVTTRTSLELLARGRELSGKLGGANVALTFGAAGDLGRHGAERIVRARGDGLDTYHPELWANALRQVLERRRPHVLLIPASTIGHDFAARAAGELQFGMTADCVGVDIAKAGRLLQQKPAFGGNIVSVIMGATTPQLATVRARMYEPLDPRSAEAAVEDELVELQQPGLRLLERRPHDAAGVQLDEADTVLLLGERSPDLDGPVVGVTQSVVERGDAPRRRLVGLLGRRVAPRLLVAVGVPGTAEEISGIVKARVVVSIAGGDEMNERADVTLEGDPARLAPALLG